MIPILSSAQIREADQYTIKHEPIHSIDLMERASKAFVTAFVQHYPEKRAINVFCGTGNNGGDGLAISRLLQEKGWGVSVFVVGNPDKGSEDFKTNLSRQKDYQQVKSKDDFPKCGSGSIIIDGLFGSGLSRPIDGLYAELIQFLNNQPGAKVSIDIASGLFADQPIARDAVVFKPHLTLSFQLPKLSFFLPEFYPYVGEWQVVDIGLNQTFIDKCETNYYFTTEADVASLLPYRSKFAHKNEVGRLLIVVGSKGKVGAAVLCARAAFKAGVGLVNVYVPKCGTQIIQISIPEAMVVEDEGEDEIQNISVSDDTTAIGPGLGMNAKTAVAFRQFLKKCTKPLVIDADAINIISENKDLLKEIPKESILTPHPGEFKRLVGDWEHDFEKLEKLRVFCQNNQLNVVLKGAYSAVCESDGIIHFNSTGNPSMATAGSGDVLTGIIGALLAQGLKPIDALKLGVYLHGKAGDEAVKWLGSSWIQASDIIDFVGSSFTCSN